MNRKILLGAVSTSLVVAIVLMITQHYQGGNGLSASAQTRLRSELSDHQDQDRQLQEQKFDRLADDIIVGLVSEEQFEKMGLSDEETLEVFRKIRDKRGWTIDDESLARALKERKADGDSAQSPKNAAAAGSCNQAVEMEYGTNYSSYPLAQVKPNPGECGNDADDITLVYRTPKWPNASPDSVKMWSNLWWVRYTVSGCYYSRFGGLLVNGLCSSTTRACVGSCAKWLGRDLNYLYLWHK